MMSKTERLHREWEERLSEFEASGQTATAWCAAREINIHRFRYWSSKLRGSRRRDGQSGEIRWLSVPMKSSTTGERDTLTIRVGCATVEVHEGFNSTLFKQVVQALADAW